MNRYALITTSQHAFGARYGILRMDTETFKKETIIPVCFKEEFLKHRDKLIGIFKRNDQIILSNTKYTKELLSTILEGEVTDCEVKEIADKFGKNELHITILNNDTTQDTPIPFTIDGFLYVPDIVEYLKPETENDR